jgi:iron uptake system component EfeO
VSKGVRLTIVGLVLAALVAVGIVLTTRPTAGPPGPGIAISAGLDDCGAGWTHPEGGRQTFSITNGTAAGMEVSLQDPSTHGVYLDVEGFGAGATVSRDVVLADGRYRFACFPADGDPSYGPVVAIRGAGRVADPTPALVPVTRNDLIGPAKTYQAWISSRLPVLEQDVVRLDADARAGDVAAARSDWLVAHTEYASLGAAYDAFGDYDAAIDGEPSSGSTALGDPGLEGFHKIEALLWADSPPDELVPHTAALVHSVQALAQAFPGIRVEPADVGLRAHEILENALQFTLTGADDAGSGSGLATLDANILDSQQALAPLHEVLASRYRRLDATTSQLAALRALVESHRSAAGVWTPLDRLSPSDREKLDAGVDRALELLAPVAAICDPRRTS